MFRLHRDSALQVLKRIAARKSTTYVAAALLVCAAAASVTRGFQEAEQPAGPPGLRGILPADVPSDLGFGAFSVLEGAWADWAGAASEDVAKLYDPETDVAGQKAAIDQLRSRIRVMDRAIADSRYKSIQPQLMELRGRLARRVDVTEGALKTLELDPEQAKNEQLAARKQALSTAVKQLRPDLNKIAGGTPWLAYVRADQLENLAVDKESLPASIELLNGVNKKFQNRGSIADAKQAEFFNRPIFNPLADAVTKMLEAANLQSTPPDEEKLRGSLGTLIGSLEAYESDATRENAAAVRANLDAVEGLAVDGGAAVRLPVSRHYTNYNFIMTVSEGFMSRATRESRTESRPISDQISGANVRGTSTTNAQSGINLQPSANGARFQATLDGATSSNTTSSTSQATIYSRGNHSFHASRDVLFDGEEFTLLGPGQIQVNPSTRHYGASTSYDGGLFAGTARRRAIATANGRLGQSYAVTRQRIRDQVLPRFEEESGKSFADFNKQLQERYKPMRDSGLYPDKRVINSTDSQVNIYNRIMVEGELAGGDPNPAKPPSDGALLQVHESVLNNLFSKMKFAGQAMNEQQVRDELKRAFKELLGADVDFTSEKAPAAEQAQAAPATDAPAEGEEEATEPDDPSMQFLFDATDPIRFEISDGAINLILRTGLRREGKDDIPTQVITVPLTYRLEGDKLIIDRGSVKVAAKDRSQGSFAQAGVLRKRVQSAFPTRTRDRILTIEREDKEPLKMTVDNIVAANGWVTISLR